MKKIAITILALLYITSFTGVTINMHYCMGELVNWDFSHNKDQNCPNCGMKGSDSNGCCHDQQKLLKIDTPQKMAEAALQLPLFITSPALAQPTFDLAFAFVPSIIEEHPASNAPPRSSGLAVYLRNCIFLI